MPATANGYSQSARVPSCLNNNLWKDAFILIFIMISNNPSSVQRQTSKKKHRTQEMKENTERFC